VIVLANSRVLLTVIVGVLVLAAGLFTFILLQNPVPPNPTNTTNTTSTTTAPEIITLTVFSDNATNEYTMAKLMELPSVSGSGGFKKSTGTILGPFNYTGILVKTLLQELGEIPVDYSLEVLSSDGLTTYFTKLQVDGYFTGYTPEGEDAGIINSTLVLAYYENGSPLIEGGPLRMVMLNEEGNLTDGYLWAKDVVSIRLVREVEPRILQLEGVAYNSSIINACWLNYQLLENPEWPLIFS